VYAALTVLGLVLQGLAGRPEDPFTGLTGEAALSAAIGVWSLAGGLLAAHRPANPIGWIMGATALVWALQQFCFGYAAYGLLARPGSLPAAISMALLYVTMVLLFELGIALLFLLFPDGRLPSARWRPVLWAGLVAGAVMVPAAITDPRPIGNLGVRSPLQAGAALHAILTPLFLVAFLVLFAVLLASVVSPSTGCSPPPSSPPSTSSATPRSGCPCRSRWSTSPPPCTSRTSGTTCATACWSRSAWR